MICAPRLQGICVKLRQGDRDQHRDEMSMSELVPQKMEHLYKPLRINRNWPGYHSMGGFSGAQGTESAKAGNHMFAKQDPVLETYPDGGRIAWD